MVVHLPTYLFAVEIPFALLHCRFPGNRALLSYTFMLQCLLMQLYRSRLHVINIVNVITWCFNVSLYGTTFESDQNF